MTVEPDRQWDQGWEEHEREQLRRMARLTLYERMLWLEQAQEMVDHLQRQRRGAQDEDAAEPST